MIKSSDEANLFGIRFLVKVSMLFLPGHGNVAAHRFIFIEFRCCLLFFKIFFFSIGNVEPPTPLRTPPPIGSQRNPPLKWLEAESSTEENYELLTPQPCFVKIPRSASDSVRSGQSFAPRTFASEVQDSPLKPSSVNCFTFGEVFTMLNRNCSISTAKRNLLFIFPRDNV